MVACVTIILYVKKFVGLVKWPNFGFHRTHSSRADNVVLCVANVAVAFNLFTQWNASLLSHRHIEPTKAELQ